MTEQSICTVIPVFNGAKYVDQALGSVAMQCRLPDEVIVVDDGSSDGSAEIAARWTGILPIRVLRLAANSGCWAARNAAIESTDADLIALLDVDDIWLPDHLAVLLAAYEAQPGVITANALMWVEQKAIASRGWNVRRPVPPPSEQMEQLLLDNFVFVATLFSRKLCVSVGGFRAFSIGCEDWDLWLRIVPGRCNAHVRGCRLFFIDFVKAACRRTMCSSTPKSKVLESFKSASTTALDGRPWRTPASPDDGRSNSCSLRMRPRRVVRCSRRGVTPCDPCGVLLATGASRLSP